MKPTLRETTLDQLRQDPGNANLGTERGKDALAYSLEAFGAGRSILLAKDGTILAGNKTALAAAKAGIADVIVVPSDGSKIIAVQRTDLEPGSDEARGVALFDNRTSELDLSWDPAAILAAYDEGVDLTAGWDDAEIEELRGQVPDFDPVGLDEQGRLDEKAKVCCPECGHEFSPSA